jgi:hypothetical protein
MSLCVYMSVCLYVCICVCLHVSALFLLYSKLLSSVGYCLQLFLENSDHYLFNHFFCLISLLLEGLFRYVM